MKVVYDNSKFDKEMRNIIEYSFGFLDGIELGKNKFLDNLGVGVINSMKEFVDSMARVNPEILQHMYEWGLSGLPESRLFNIEYRVIDSGLSINSTFRQSVSIKNGSTTPFYDKARIMEYGIPVTISPKKADVLAFESEDGTVFTRGPVTVSNPGGELARGSFERTLNVFVQQYFSQSFLSSSGIIDKIKDTSAYKKNLAIGAKLGRARGRQVGYSWIVKAGVTE